MQTPPSLKLLGWSALRNEQPFTRMFSSLLETVESKKVLDEHTMSKLLFVINASTNGTFMNHG